MFLVDSFYFQRYLFIVSNLGFPFFSKVKLVAGIYYPFLKMWTEVFQRNNVYMLTLEEYRENKTTAMRKIFKFLKLGK